MKRSMAPGRLAGHPLRPLVGGAVLMASFLTLMVAPPAVHGAGFIVNDTRDLRDINLLDGVCDADGGAPGPQCTLRAAVEQANHSVGFDSITISPGTYLLSFIGSGENNAAFGDLDLTGDVSITGSGGAAATIIDANGAITLDRVFHVLPGVTVQMDSLTIRGGWGQSTGVTGANSGAGVFNQGVLTLTNSVVVDNNATLANNGGGIANTGSLSLTHVTVSNGLIHPVWDFANLGGGLYNTGSATISNSTFSGNRARNGGGGIHNTGTLTMTDTTVSGNSLRNDSFPGSGLNNPAGTATLTGSTFTGNTGGQGAYAIDNQGTLVLTNATVSGNSGNPGGGIFSRAGGSISLNNVTVANNTSPFPSPGVGLGGTMAAYQVRNSVLGNYNGTHKNCGAVLVSQGYNAANDTSCGLAATGDQQANFLALNLGALANNSGPTQTHALLAGSVAIDTANPAAPGTGAGACAATDQRGVARPQGVRCDKGAFEYQPPALPDINVTPGLLTFGASPVGVPLPPLALTVQNTGAGNLVLGSLGITGDFAKAADGCTGQTIAPAAQCTLDVVFTPTATGPRNGTLTVDSNDPDENLVMVALSGVGVPAVAGGKNLTITTGSIDLSWNGGNVQTGYTLLKYNTSTASTQLLPIAGNAIGYSDAVATNGVVYCYVLAALNGPSFLGLSDLLCGMAGAESGTVIPNGFSLSLGGTTNASMTWSAPVGGADSYLLQRIPLDGTPITNVPLAGGATSTTQPVVAAGTCFQLVAFKGAAFGTSDVLCGVPGVSTLSATGLGAALLGAGEAFRVWDVR